MKRFVYLISLITLLAMSVSAHDACFEGDLGALYPTISLDLTTRINLQTPRRYAVSPHHRFVPWNRYLYCRNDPINYFDPDGEFPFLADLAADRGAVRPLALTEIDPKSMEGGALRASVMRFRK